MFNGKRGEKEKLSKVGVPNYSDKSFIESMKVEKEVDRTVKI